MVLESGNANLLKIPLKLCISKSRNKHKILKLTRTLQ